MRRHILYFIEHIIKQADDKRTLFGAAIQVDLKWISQQALIDLAPW